MARRKRRTQRTGLMDRPWVLALMSAAFVAAGVGMLIDDPDDWVMSVVVIVFFGSCLLVFITQMVQALLEKRGVEISSLPIWVAIVGAAGFAVACGLILDSLLSAPTLTSIPLAVVCVVGIVFFGGGALLLLYRQIKDMTRNE